MDATFDDGTRCWGLEKAGITVKSTKPIRASPAGSFDTGEQLLAKSVRQAHGG